MLDYFAWRNQKMKNFCEECESFSKLVVKMATHLSRFAALQEIPFRNIKFTGPWWTSDGTFVFKLRIRGRPVGPRSFRSTMKADDF